MTLVEDVLIWHVEHTHGYLCADIACTGAGLCNRCADDWPCDAYRLAVQIEAVKALHERIDSGTDPNGVKVTPDFCADCHDGHGDYLDWPCHTIRALEEDKT